MMLKQHLNLNALSCVLLLAATGVLAQEDFDCKITSEATGWDLTSLAGEHTVSRERTTPPSKFRDDITFNLCQDLTRKDGVADKDQCESGTRACLTKTNIKDESERVTAVIPLARPSREYLKYESLPSSNKGVSLSFTGPTYPDPITNEQISQSFKIDIICDPESTGDPELKSYDGKEVWVEWHAKAGCPLGLSEPPSETKPDTGDGKESSSVGSGMGWFFLLLLLAFVAYFGLGAYYNYSTYGATGMDLIPHRDFWREVPYMLRDVVSHLCSAVRPRSSSSRGGYIAV